MGFFGVLMQMMPVPECEKEGAHRKEGDEQQPSAHQKEGVLGRRLDHHPADARQQEKTDRAQGVNKATYHEATMTGFAAGGKPESGCRQVY